LRDELRLREREWERMAREGNYVLALCDNRPVAMASAAGTRPTESVGGSTRSTLTPDFRGTGVAQDLVRHVARWARGQGVATLGLHVTETMGRARAFYQSMGFEENGGSEFMVRDRRLKLLVMTTNVRLNVQLQ
jgi:GNAT superfamily N-acetyltransferase